MLPPREIVKTGVLQEPHVAPFAPFWGWVRRGGAVHPRAGSCVWDGSAWSCPGWSSPRQKDWNFDADRGSAIRQVTAQSG